MCAGWAWGGNHRHRAWASLRGRKEDRGFARETLLYQVTAGNDTRVG